MYMQVQDSDEAASSGGSPQPSTGTVEEMQRQLAGAKKQADSDLAVALAGLLEEAQEAAQKLQERCARLEADMAELQASSQMPCMPWVSLETVPGVCAAPWFMPLQLPPSARLAELLGPVGGLRLLCQSGTPCLSP